MKQGWTYKKLGEVCEILNGFAFKSSEYVSDGIRVIRITNVQKGYVEDSEPKFYPISTQNELKRYLLFENDLLISLTGNVGRVGLIEKSLLPAYLNQRVGCLRIKKEEELTIPYLYYLLNSNRFENDCILSSRGAAQKNMSTVWLGDYIIPLPPLSEQSRIASRLDAAFGEIEGLKAKAEAQLREARTLFQAALTQEMKPKQGWEEKKLKDCVLSITDGDHQPPPKSLEGIPFITISNIIKETNKIDFENTFYVPQSYFNELKGDRKPIEGDVLYTVTGSFGIPVMIDFKKDFCFQRHIALIRPNQKRMSTQYLFYWILSSYAIAQAEDTATGTAQRTVSLNSLRNFSISLPPLPAQQSIVSRLDALSEKVRELEEAQKKVIAECDALKQALLREVFE